MCHFFVTKVVSCFKTSAEFASFHFYLDEFIYCQVVTFIGIFNLFCLQKAVFQALAIIYMKIDFVLIFTRTLLIISTTN